MFELHPDREPLPDADWRAPGAIPPAFRTFGKFPRTSHWWPGDLILTRAVQPDRVSTAIKNAQKRGGYEDTDSNWTHAAVYLGDGVLVCEATFDSIWTGGSVRVTHLWDYCGDYVIRVRRSKFVEQVHTGWLMAIYAMTHLRKDYDFSYIWKLARQAYAGRGFWQSDVKVSIKPSALICSTLYADAHNRVTRHLLGDSNGLCVPAYLSQSNEMTDIETDWLRIARRHS